MNSNAKNITTAFLSVCFFIWFLTADSQVPIVILCAVSIHELGHVFAGRLSKNRMGSIAAQTGGFLLSARKAYGSYFSEALIALSGPAFNLLSVILILPFSFDAKPLFTQTSIALAVLNLLPINGFDGLHVTECVAYVFLPYRFAYKMCSLVSFLAAFFLWSISVYLVIKTGTSISFFLFSVAIFFKTLKSGEFESIFENNRD